MNDGLEAMVRATEPLNRDAASGKKTLSQTSVSLFTGYYLYGLEHFSSRDLTGCFHTETCTQLVNVTNKM